MILRFASLACALLVAGAAPAQTGEPAAPTAAPKTIALVAAIGAKFNVAVEGFRTGSRLDYYRRSRVDAPGDVLNRVVLQALDREVARVQPDSQRLYLSMPAARTDGVSPSQKDEIALGKVVEALANVSGREKWHRVVVATPAYRPFEYKGVADKLQGLGISVHPLESGLSTSLDLPPFVDLASAADGETPEGKRVRSHVYIAPYAYLTIWVLDPKTLAVLDRQDRIDHRKLANPDAGTLDLVEAVGRENLARQIVALIGRSVHEAIANSELAGKVEVREVREVKPDAPR